MIRLALYHPQIPQNTGTLFRLASCLGFAIDLIKPFGFIFNNKKLKRAGMDYFETADYKTHEFFSDFLTHYSDKRLIALEANNVCVSHAKFSFNENDIIIVGSEHYGFLENDLKKISCKIKVPMINGRRSINMALASTIVISEAFSQLNLFPHII